MTMFVQPCHHLVTTLRQFQNTRLCQGCHKVALWQPCDNVRTTLSQPCDSFKIQGCAKVVPRLCQGCKTALWQPCANVVTTLCQGCDNLVISVWEVLVLHCCCALLQNLVGNSEETTLRKQTEASVDVPYPPLEIVNTIPFCLFSLYLYFSILSLLPLHHPFFLFRSILCPPKIKTTIYYTMAHFCILFHTMTYLFFNNAFYKLEKTILLCLSSNLSYLGT